MNGKRHLASSIIMIIAMAVVLLPIRASSHCDTLDGPVVADARLALEKRDVTPVLKWVAKEHEQEIRDAFASALIVREKGAEARKLADMYFFETLVRMHREGEGAPYTGLKPAGTVEPELTAADRALEAGSVDALADELAAAVRDGIKKRFSEASSAKQQAGKDVDAGRSFVEAYVEYVHFIENIHDLVGGESIQEHGRARAH